MSLLSPSLRRLTPLCRRVSVKCAQQHRTKFSKPDIHVYLRETVPGLGEKGEITLVNLAQARNYLVPFGLAYYTPRILGKPILPDGWEAKEREEDFELETIVPAFSTITVESRSTSTSSPTSSTSTTAQTARIQSHLDLALALRSLPPLTFKRVRMKATDTKIYGSVTADDVVRELLEVHNVVVDRESVLMKERIKNVGEFEVEVALGVGENGKVVVRVEDSEV
ncbi:uncharacterized protein EV422DRAFT_508589 [Fimicolochytrium jonesii]|uniref:uncharacterized protein n=1 Tax=Fimicolochytrium jonesii TaxID=1396493 RepID=UPI0022FF390B|nr:uncharacterized protein EV422DRAFT_508589 [Fimicolochytrium jonesii]KAI8818061.1 hypothetical protein EV422DRAFT_508589 [Fimicolochytrium jonesii]